MANALRTNSSPETNSDLSHVELKPLLLHQEGDVNEIGDLVSIPASGIESHPSEILEFEEKDGWVSWISWMMRHKVRISVQICICRPKKNKLKIKADDDGDAGHDYDGLDEELNSYQDELFFEGGQSGSKWSPHDLPINSNLSSGPWLVVPSELGFTLDSGAQCFVGKVALRNISSGYISFMVMPTTPNFFSLFPREAILPPGHGLDVIITTKRNLGKNPPSVEVLLRSGFYVLATPIYFSSQLSQKKVKLLWKAYGSPLFPPESAECHLIKRLIPFGGDEEKGGVLGDYNIMEQAAMGSYTALVKELPDLKTMLKRRQRRMELRGEFVESDYVKSWMPAEVGPEQERFLKAHFRELTKSVTRVREDMDAATTITRMTGFTLLVVALAFFIFHYLSIFTDGA